MFSRKTIIEVIDKLLVKQNSTHNQLDTFFMKYSLEHLIDDKDSMTAKKRKLINYLIDENIQIPNKDSLISEIIIELIENEIDICEQFKTDFEKDFPTIYRMIYKDGYIIENKKVSRVVPSSVLIQNNEEYIFKMLDKYGWSTLRGHLEQAIKNYSNSDWAACNAQLRTFLEGLFDHMADEINAKSASPVNLGSSNVKRGYLANINPPIFERNLNEWTDDGKNFINGIFKRLHPAGAHIGLSNEQDSTLRIQLVFLIAAYYIEKFDKYYK